MRRAFINYMTTDDALERYIMPAVNSRLDKLNVKLNSSKRGASKLQQLVSDYEGYKNDPIAARDHMLRDMPITKDMFNAYDDYVESFYMLHSQ